LKNRTPRPHRKKTLAVPGDVFIANEVMIIINTFGYSWVNPLGVVIEKLFKEEGSWSPDRICNNDEAPFFEDCNYLGNALTDEWEDG
jgi:hypothetical protein